MDWCASRVISWLPSRWSRMVFLGRDDESPRAGEEKQPRILLRPSIDGRRGDDGSGSKPSTRRAGSGDLRDGRWGQSPGQALRSSRRSSAGDAHRYNPDPGKAADMASLLAKPRAHVLGQMRQHDHRSSWGEKSMRRATRGKGGGGGVDGYTGYRLPTCRCWEVQGRYAHEQLQG